MGCNRPVHHNQRSVDGGREKSLHQLVGNESSAVGLTNVCYNKNKHSHSFVDRQLHNNRLYKSQRRHSFQGFVQSSTGNMGMMHMQTDLPDAAHIPGVVNVITDAESRKAMEPSDWMLDKNVFRALQRLWGPLEVNLFAARPNAQLPWYYSFKPDPGAKASPVMDESQSICFPPFRPNRKMSQEIGSGSSEN